MLLLATIDMKRMPFRPISRFTAAAVLIVILFGVATGQGTNCPQTQFCAVCAGTSGCGWCASTLECLPGNNVGPVDGSSCPLDARQGSVWYADQALCAVPAAVGCDACVGLAPTTGWCEALQQCFIGTPQGPSGNITCAVSARGYPWLFSGDVASNAFCTAMRSGDCSACQLANWGWCVAHNQSSTSRCLPGTPEGPTYVAATACAAWVFGDHACEAYQAPTCNACFQAGYIGVGWCPSTRRCVPGGPEGPTAPGGGPDARGCPQTPDGYAWTVHASLCDLPHAGTCAACLAVAPDAGWCRTSSRCWLGDDHGPFNGNSCPPLAPDGNVGWVTNALGCAFLVATTCQQCTAIASPVGWCPTTRQCMPGGASGPTTADGSGGPSCQASDAYGQWTYEPASCASFAAATCNACTSVAGLGWCAPENRCFQGTSTGPEGNVSCGTWRWSTASCAVPDCDVNISYADVVAYATPVALPAGTPTEHLSSVVFEFNASSTHVPQRCVNLSWRFSDGTIRTVPVNGTVYHEFDVSSVPGWSSTTPDPNLLFGVLTAATNNDTLMLHNITVSVFSLNATVQHVPLSDVLDWWSINACADDNTTHQQLWTWRLGALNATDAEAAAAANLTAMQEMRLLVAGAMPSESVTSANAPCSVLRGIVVDFSCVSDGNTTAPPVFNVTLQPMPISSVFGMLYYASSRVGSNAGAGADHRLPPSLVLDGACSTSVTISDGIEGGVQCSKSFGSFTITAGASASIGFPLRMSMASGGRIERIEGGVSGTFSVDISGSGGAVDASLSAPLFDHSFECHTLDIPRPCFFFVGEIPVFYTPFLSLRVDGSASVHAVELSAAASQAFSGSAEVAYVAGSGLSFHDSTSSHVVHQGPNVRSSCGGTLQIGLTASLGVTIDELVDVSLAVKPTLAFTASSESPAGSPTENISTVIAGSLELEGSVMGLDADVPLWHASHTLSSTQVPNPCTTPAPTTPAPTGNGSVWITGYTSREPQCTPIYSNSSSGNASCAVVHDVHSGKPCASMMLTVQPGDCTENGVYTFNVYADLACQEIGYAQQLPWGVCVEPPPIPAWGPCPGEYWYDPYQNYECTLRHQSEVEAEAAQPLTVKATSQTRFGRTSTNAQG